MNQPNILAPVAQLALPDSAGLTSRAQAVVDFIATFEITDNEGFGLAAEELQQIKARMKKLDEQRTAITGPLNAATKAVNELFRGPTDLLVNAEQALKSKMLGWQRKVEAEAAEARRVAEAAAEAERRRLEEEAAAHRAAAAAQAEAAAAAQAAGDMQGVVLAQAAAQRAQDAAAAAATTVQVITAAPVAAVAPPKVRGISTSSKTTFEVTNLLALVEHIAKHPELINLVCADEVRLRAYIKGVGPACNLPGVRIGTEQVMSARAA